MKTKDSQDVILGAQARLWSCSFNQMISMCLKCAIQLRIPDAIHKHGGAAVPLTALLSTLQIPPSKTEPFRCIMRILTHNAALFNPEPKPSPDAADEEWYSLNASSRLLLSPGGGEDDDKAAEVRHTSSVLLLFHPLMQEPWSFLDTWLREDGSRTPWEIAHGTASFWGYLETRDPSGELMATFYDCMTNDSKLVGEVLVSRCKDMFDGVTSLVDVGGGAGTMAAAVAKAFPEIKCTVLDRPHVVKDLQGEGNLEFVGGDMFLSIPQADAVLLKWILHDWDEENCIKVLKVCKEAIASPKGKLIIIDMVVDEKRLGERNFGEVQLCFDLFMMAMVNGKERTEKEWKRLFSAAGFSNYKISTVMGLRSVIEVFP
ncbi:unnamed protein product [Linum trigynum]|uniref:Trans-resveratrol di-O-methyltransferase-like n=1 Tax=Linum trigynum TaxID=586398 RepID=A0AAV2CJW3_9ROSI